MNKGTVIVLNMIRQSGVILLTALTLAILVNQMRPHGILLFDDWSNRADFNRTISSDEAKALFFNGGAVFIDARPRDFYQLGHIAGALNLSLNDFEKSYNEVMAGVPSETLIITYCDGDECSLGNELAGELFKRGYNNVYVLLNALTVWDKHDLPIEMGS